MKLALNAFAKFAMGITAFALVLFLPAGTFVYPRAWLMMGLLFVPVLILGVVLLVKNPDLLKKRLDTREKEKTQKGVVALSALTFLVGFAVAAFDFRFLWSSVPVWLTSVCSAAFLAGYAMYAEVMRENVYLSRTVKIEEHQKVIDTGLYSVVRHPMYFATLLLFLPMPIILGSFYALIPFLCYVPIIAARIVGEEKLLKNELRGY
ncbi:MAG: isoprenylcysteine carboxylmethyltransferase family protein, partial [Clostridia bacterium]|nr:isoprenylcysteine carboxylmethyltransferase family protein [Clostridia bacterium]